MPAKMEAPAAIIQPAAASQPRPRRGAMVFDVFYGEEQAVCCAGRGRARCAERCRWGRAFFSWRRGGGGARGRGAGGRVHFSCAHGVGDEVALVFGDGVAAGLAVLHVGNGVLELVFGREAEGEEREVFRREMVGGVHAWKALSQREQSAADAGFDGAERVSGHLGDFRVGEAVEEGHLEGFALFGGEQKDGGAGLLHHQIAFGFVGEVAAGGEDGVFNLLGGFFTAEVVDGAVARDDGEPSTREPRVAIKPSGLRQTCMKISCKISSAAAASRSTRRATEYTTLGVTVE